MALFVPRYRKKKMKTCCCLLLNNNSDARSISYRPPFFVRSRRGNRFDYDVTPFELKTLIYRILQFFLGVFSFFLQSRSRQIKIPACVAMGIELVCVHKREKERKKNYKSTVKPFRGGEIRSARPFNFHGSYRPVKTFQHLLLLLFFHGQFVIYIISEPPPPLSTLNSYVGIVYAVGVRDLSIIRSGKKK